METDLNVNDMNNKLVAQGILGPLNLNWTGMDKACLFCVTENRSKEDMDRLVKALEVM